MRKTLSMTASKLDPPGGDDLPSVFSGTVVTAGQGMAEVLATGARSELGRIGKALHGVEVAPTPLQKQTGRLVRVFAIAGLAACAVVVIAYAITRGGGGQAWKQGLLAGIAMAMSVLPEEFPVVLTVYLALVYPGVQSVEHVYFYAVHGADDATRRGYLERAYALGRDFAPAESAVGAASHA